MSHSLLEFWIDIFYSKWKENYKRTNDSIPRTTFTMLVYVSIPSVVVYVLSNIKYYVFWSFFFSSFFFVLPLLIEFIFPSFYSSFSSTSFDCLFDSMSFGWISYVWIVWTPKHENKLHCYKLRTLYWDIYDKLYGMTQVFFVSSFGCLFFWYEHYILVPFGVVFFFSFDSKHKPHSNYIYWVRRCQRTGKERMKTKKQKQMSTIT